MCCLNHMMRRLHYPKLRVLRDRGWNWDRQGRKVRFALRSSLLSRMLMTLSIAFRGYENFYQQPATSASVRRFANVLSHANHGSYGMHDFGDKSHWWSEADDKENLSFVGQGWVRDTLSRKVHVEGRETPGEKISTVR